MDTTNLFHPHFICFWFRVFEKCLACTFQTPYLFLNFGSSGEILPLNAAIEFFSQFIQLQPYSCQLWSSQQQNRPVLKTFALFEIAQLILTKCTEHNNTNNNNIHEKDVNDSNSKQHIQSYTMFWHMRYSLG